MARESEPGRLRGRRISQGRGRGRGRGYFNKSSSSGSYNQEEFKFVTSSIKQVYTYTAVKDVIFQRLKKCYGYEVASSLRYLEEYNMEGEIPTRIMRLDMDTNRREINHIGLDMLYQVDITNYINGNKDFKQNLRKSYTVMWELCNKQLQNYIKMNV